jgi:hypothetical protein
MGDAINTAMFEDDELLSQYIGWTSDAINEMKALYDGLEEAAQDHTETANKFYDLSHNIKGMGSSFNFILMTEIGTSLCLYLKNLQNKSALSKTVLNAHVRAFQVVLENRIVGNGGAKGNALISRLETIIKEET